jgi:CTP synthase
LRILIAKAAKTVYEVPLLLESRGVGDYITKQLGLGKRKPKLKEWQNFVEVIKKPNRPVLKIGIVAKYMHHEDTYTSVFEALKAAAWANKAFAELVWVEAEHLENEENLGVLKGLDGIVVPGGFGPRGVEGKISAGRFAMDNKVPYLGLCLGMQTAVIALARKVLKTTQANSTEMDPDVKHPVISLMADQKQVIDKGGTMRLGDYPCILTKGTKIQKEYSSSRILERHRHRFEFNNSYRAKLEAAGLVLAGLSPDKRLVELIELSDHPYFVASQFHPEFKSRPNRPHPMFNGFIKAMLSAKSKPLTPGKQSKVGVK